MNSVKVSAKVFTGSWNPQSTSRGWIEAYSGKDTKESLLQIFQIDDINHYFDYIFLDVL